MNIDFAAVAVLPGILHYAFGEDHQYPNAVYQSLIELGGDKYLVFGWDIMTGNLTRVCIEFGNNVIRFERIKTFENLKQLLSLIPLPYPENWP